MSSESRALVAHLFRRAGFGADTALVDTYASKGYTAAVTDLLNAKPKGEGLFEVGRDVRGVLISVTNSLPDAQDAWVRSMAKSPAPLVERMTLFLSNHFATAYSPDNHIDAVSLSNQQKTFRSYVFGSFAGLTHKMIDDIALACFLNNDHNLKDAPNENLGRELMELFLLGAGNFTERDVKEAARALTGYKLVAPLPGQRAKLAYDAKLHDDGAKTILGVTKPFTPHTLVDHLLAQPAAHRFVARKLINAFAGPSDDALLDAVAASLRKNWNLRDALRTIFLSSQFQSDAARHTIAKTPAEYITTLMRTLRRDDWRDASNRMSAAGQTLFKPASVAGWPTGARLFGTGAMLARYNAADSYAYKHVNDPRPKAPKFGADVKSWMGALGLTAVSQATTDAINAYLADTIKDTTKTRTAGVITLLAASPEFNLS